MISSYKFRVKALYHEALRVFDFLPRCAELRRISPQLGYNEVTSPGDRHALALCAVQGYSPSFPPRTRRVTWWTRGLPAFQPRSAGTLWRTNQRIFTAALGAVSFFPLMRTHSAVHFLSPRLNSSVGFDRWQTDERVWVGDNWHPQVPSLGSYGNAAKSRAPIPRRNAPGR